MIAQAVINSVSQDVREVFGGTAAAQTILLDYVDRIHKDCLHSSIYNFLNTFTTQFSSVVNQSSYTLTPTNIRRIQAVYDRTRDRILLPHTATLAPIQGGQNQVPAPGQTPEAQLMPREIERLKTVSSKQPEYYRLVGSNTLFLYPTPVQILNFDIHYEQQVATLTNVNQALTIPDDAFDMVVAGVNFLANLFLAREAPSQIWGQTYLRLKAGESLI